MYIPYIVINVSELMKSTFSYVLYSYIIMKYNTINGEEKVMIYHIINQIA